MALGKILNDSPQLEDEDLVTTSSEAGPLGGNYVVRALPLCRINPRIQNLISP